MDLKDSVPTSSVPSANEEQGTEWKPAKAELLIMFCLFFVSLAVAIDSSILVTALPTIAKDLNGSANASFWLGTSYLLTCATFQPLLAALSDIFGRKEILILSIFFFLFGSVVAAIAQDIVTLLAGRCVQGTGGGGIISLALVIFTDIVPLRQRPKYIGFVQTSWAIGTITGPLIGGGIAQHSTWRWIFYLNFPLCAIALVVVFLVVRLKTEKTSLFSKFVKVDWIGGIIFMASMTAFLLGVTWGGIQYHWTSFETLLPLCLGAVGIVATMFWERYGAKYPVIRLRVFCSRSAVGAFIGALIQGISLYGTLYYIPFYLESVKQKSPIMTGVSLLPITCGNVPASVITGIITSKFGRFRWALYTGWSFVILGTGLLLLLDITIQTWRWVLIFLVFGLGHGQLLSALPNTVQAITQTKDVGYATAMYTTVRTVGACIGVAIGGTIFQNLLAKYLAQAGLPTQIAQDAEGFLATLATSPHAHDPAYIYQILTAYSRAFRGAFLVMTVISVFGGLASLLVGRHTMDKALDSEHILRRGGLTDVEMEVPREER